MRTLAGEIADRAGATTGVDTSALRALLGDAGSASAAADEPMLFAA